MRTLLRLLATSTVLFALPTSASTAAPTGSLEARAGAPQAALQSLVVQVGAVPQATGKQTIHYYAFQRATPSLSQAGTAGSQVVVSPGDATQLFDQLARDGWEQVCTLTVVQIVEGHAPAPVTAASTTSPAASETAEPLALAIALPGSNPVSGRSLVVDVALPGAGPARLEMLDVMGRLVTERDLGSLGAGRHAVDLSADRRVTPGVYLLRLTRAGEARVARVSVID